MKRPLPEQVPRPTLAHVSPSAGSAELLVIGDVHRHWRPEDRRFLERSQPDLALFVGDLGDEDVELVREIVAIDVPKAVILGNHDAWQSFTRKRPTQKLQDSLAALDGTHLAYEVRDLPKAQISLVGARPFSWGGKSLRSPELYDQLYGITDIESSAQRIVSVAQGARFQDLMILAHNGPTGLSEHTRDIYGKDFGERPGGDWGDRDLELAIEDLRSQGFRIRAVVAGHMHHRLAHPRGATRVRFVERDGTCYVNPAVVPRLRPGDDGAVHGHFLRMKWRAGMLAKLEEIWVDTQCRVVLRETPEVFALE